ncbi:MAG: LysR family transcriptional regulator, partial [Burkholderiaceae bacterium]
MVITTDMLAAFVKVAQTLNVSVAATELGVGKGLVSKRVAQLEALVGATLFSRSTRRVSLTPAGEAYLDGARRALAEMAAAHERVRDLRAQLTGDIRMTAPVSWGQRVLAARLPEFLRAHPGIGIELKLTDRVMDLGRERIDVAL